MIRNAQECLDDYWRRKWGSRVKFSKVLEAFSTSVLQDELAGLKTTLNLHHGRQGHPSHDKYYIDLLLLQSAGQNTHSAMFAIAPQFSTGPNSKHETQLLSVLTVMANAALQISPVANEIANLELVKKASQWALTRTFHFLYQWYTTIGPNLLRTMVQLSDNDGVIDHEPLVKLISHIREYVKVWRSRRSTSRTAGEFQQPRSLGDPV